MKGRRQLGYALVLAPCLALALLCAADHAIAQRSDPQTQAPRALAIEVSKSRVVRLSRPARDVLVANPAIADVVLRSAEAAFIIAKKIGETNVFFFDAAGRQIDAIEVNVRFDSAAVVDALRRAVPNEDIAVSTANQSLMLTGTVASQQIVDNAQQIARQFVVDDKSIINLLKVRNENQVLLRVRVSEMSRAVIKELGVNPSALFHIGKGLYGYSSGTLTIPGVGQSGAAVTTTFGGATAAFATGATPFAGAALSIPFGAATGLTALVEALDSNGLVKTLAEPNLTAVSGETASFLVGGNVPICQVTTIGTTGSQQSFTYKPFGIQLTFTPIVLSNNLINVRITAELSTLVTSAAGGAIPPGTSGACGGAPAFTNRNVTTTVELPSGGSIAIAGLLQNDDSSNLQGVPGLKDVPVLGALFASKAYQENLDDLVITVTTVLARPTGPGELSYPTDGFGPASDFNFYILNHMQSHYAPAADAVPPSQVRNTFGMILE